MSIAEWREMPKWEDELPSDEADALRDRLRDTAAALDATLNEVDPPYADFRAILKRLNEEGLM